MVVVLGAAVWHVMDKANRIEREAARARIQRSEVSCDDLELQPGYGSAAYRLLGRIRNKSQRYTLTELKLKLTMRDCNAQGDCETVGETEESIYVTIPPGQARDLDEYVYFSHLGQLRGRLQWDYQILEIQGR